MQRTTQLLRTSAPLRTLTTSATRPQLIRSAVIAPLRARSPSSAWSPSSSTPTWKTSLLQGQQTRTLVKDASAFKQNKDATYSDIKPLTEQPNDDVLLIDVREPDEVMLGSIPSSVNIPLSNFEKALDLDSSDFMRAYGFRKPKKDQNMIFYCKAGIRAGTATGLAKDKGWKNVRNYPGSYDEWEAKQKQSNDD